MKSEDKKEKTELVFKLEKEPAGFGQVFAQNCKIKIKNTEGPLYLNYEKRPERVVGFYKNLRQEGEVILADIRLHEQVQGVEHRLEYSIEGAVLAKNDKNEAESVEISGVGALMNSVS